MLTIDVVTLFPEVIAAVRGARAFRGGRRRPDWCSTIWCSCATSPTTGTRRWTTTPTAAARGWCSSRSRSSRRWRASVPTAPIVLLSARGRRFGHDDAVRFSLGERLTLLCGHYKDVDQRVAEGLATEELSVGDFVLSGGEPAALCVLDAVVRLLPGALERPRDRPARFALRRAAEPAELHPAAGVSGARRCRRCCCRAITPGSRRGGRRRPSG